MKRENIRTMYRLEGEIDGLAFSGDVTKYEDGRISIYGTFRNAENGGSGSFNEEQNGNVSYNYGGNKEVVDLARVALPKLVEQEKAYK